MLHIGAFSLDIDSQRPTVWQKIAPQTRLLCTLLFVFATALTPNGHWWTWAIYGTGLLILICLSRVTLSVLGRRVAVEFVFVGVVLLGTLFREGGEILWSWGWLRITREGLIILGSVTLKTLLCSVMANILVLTASISSLLQALVILKMPPLLVAIFASMVRYVGLLMEEFKAMRRAALARNLLNSPHWQRMVIGNLIGSLFIRTYDRGDRIYQAMVCRGYTGSPLITEIPRTGSGDRMILILTVILILLGQSIYFW